jgi:enolase-phosphatase E1
VTNRRDPLEGLRGILLDIEGTTTPISFVHDVLFPDAREQIPAACASGDPAYADAIARLRVEHAEEKDAMPFGDGSAYALRLMDEDRKSTGLKALQGILWQRGYEAGRLRGRLFADTEPAIRAWRARGLDVRIFSSGSVLAQKLLFGHTEAGNLLPLLGGHYDTTTGSKKEAVSYERIAADWGVEPGRVLFLSDVVAELDAARSAGMRTGLMLRPGNAELGPDGANGHPTYETFVPLYAETA